MKTPVRLVYTLLAAAILSLTLWAPTTTAQQQQPRPTPRKEAPQKATPVDYIWVSKKTSKLYLVKDKKIIHTYSVSFGANPVGHKTERGDERTPEGTYRISEKRVYGKTKFYKALLIDYPNAADKAQARKRNVHPGELIMIHGVPNHFKFLPEALQRLQAWFNWTDGCIAVTNAEMDQIFSLIHTGIPIVISPRN